MRTHLFTLLVVAGLCATTSAQGKANTLTPKEIAEGWLLLFDGDTTFGWMIRGKTEVANGWLVLEDKAAALFHAGFPADSELSYEEAALDSPEKTELRRRVLEAGARIIFRSPLRVRHIKLRPQATKPLFNGTDLTGWQTFPGDKYKSKYTVVDGAINVKDGPGDLQTEGKYGDFILQLECKSNGKHLNSGIFFRCRPGEYQNGYEAQIRNQFTPEPTQDYTIEVYDPKTHELVDKKKIKSTAFDFGTGAIYRRVPARKQMSQDGEWFTLTVVAQGNHFATWVNGVQQVDWYDNRPPSDNARTGYRRHAGHISIQGHDPTTDLSFRNIRMVELPPAQ